MPLKIETPADVVPYYPYIVVSMASNKENGGTIYLSSKSYVDEEEEEHLAWDLECVKKYWRQCKRKKVPFNEKEALKKTCMMRPQEYQKEIVHRVKEHGDKVTTDGLHNQLHDYYRKVLYEEMVANGWDNNRAYIWCFGWERYLEKIRKEQQEKSDKKTPGTNQKSETD